MLIDVFATKNESLKAGIVKLSSGGCELNFAQIEIRVSFEDYKEARS